MQSVSTAFQQNAFGAIRRRRTQVVAFLVLLPALLPVLVLVLPGVHIEESEDVQAFKQVAELFYVRLCAPLLALFFAAMLVADDVESQTISYLLTRPVPRSAWVAGRFLAYLAVTSAMMAVSLCALYAACCTWPGRLVSPDSVRTLFQFLGAGVAALVGYGAFCAFLGATVPRPVIVGLLLIVGWQRIAALAPGVTDFFTIEKYVLALLPEGGLNEAAILTGTSVDSYRDAVSIGPATGIMTLAAVALACLIITTLMLREREFTRPVATTD